jgi:hypothetical protein
MKDQSIPRQENFDLLRNDALLRWQRKLRIAPREGLGAARRAAFVALLSWLPIVVWAALNDRLVDADSGEPLLVHFGIHVRCLVAVPLFVLAEATAARVIGQIVGQFRASGIVSDEQDAAFRGVLTETARLRDSTLPCIAVLGLAAAWVLGSPEQDGAHEMTWAASGGELGFGGWWFLYVARPVFVVLALGWLWRIVLVAVLFRRLGRLDLSLVPSHPDRNGGLGFVRKLPSALFLVTLAISVVLASRWMHDVVYHAQSLAALKLPFATFVVLWSAMLLSPLFLLAPSIAAMKRRALLDYGALIGEHGRLVHRRWILRRPVPPSELMDAPELGPVADTAAIYEAVAKTSLLPLGKSTLMMVLEPIALPMLFVVTQQIPLREVLLKLVRTLV